VITDVSGVPLTVLTTPANLRDDTAAPAVLDRLDATVRATPGLNLKPPAVVLVGDAGYGFDWLIDKIRDRGWIPLLARRGGDRPHGSGLGATRYVVERTLAWLGSARRLKLCYERCDEHFQAFHDLQAATLCFKKTLVAQSTEDGL
jgi:transposase